MVLPEMLVSLVSALPRELLIQDEVTLTTLVNPSAQQGRLKIQFWEEYNQATKEGRRMLPSKVCFGVCTLEYFDEFVQSSRNLAWLISPRPSYQIRVAELIEQGLKAIEEIFTLKVDSKNVVAVKSLQLSALRMLDMRRHGGYTQRQEIKQLTRHVSEKAGGAPVLFGEGSIEQLEEQVRQLEERIEMGKNQNGSVLHLNPVVKDVVEVEGG
jgi:hypothetical protein